MQYENCLKITAQGNVGDTANVTAIFSDSWYAKGTEKPFKVKIV